MDQLIGVKSGFVAEERELLAGQKQSDRLARLKQILPPFNFSAKSAKNIYRLENVVFERESIDTANLQNAIEECSETGSGPLSALTGRNFAEAQNQRILGGLAAGGGNQESDRSRPGGRSQLELRELFAANCAQKRDFGEPRAGWTKRQTSRDLGVPRKIFDALVDAFYDKQLTESNNFKFIQSNLKAMKLKCYIGVLLLLINNLKLEISGLIKHFRVNANE